MKRLFAAPDAMPIPRPPSARLRRLPGPSARLVLLILLSALLAGTFQPAAAQSPDAAEQPNPSTNERTEAGDDAGKAGANGQHEAKEDEEERSITSGTVTIDGATVAYEAVAGTLPFLKADGSPAASIFYVSYTRSDVPDRSRRPVAFCFNGGPGSSSVWLHLGGLGPRRVVLPDDGTTAPAPPFALAENPFSLLDVADLVFIDPVSTGFSRAGKEEDPKQFHGINQDIESVGEFIRLFASREGRWNSPKFLVGESYGGLRAAGLADHLQERHGMFLNGVALVSAVVDFRTLLPDHGSDLPYVVFLPTMTAVAFHHRALPESRMADFTATLEAAEEFASTTYSQALFLGARLPEEERRKVAVMVASLTGLPEEVVLNANLRVSPSLFRKELLRSRGQTVGRFDARILGRDADRSGDSPEYDPSYAVVQGAYSSTLNAYVRGELRFDSDLPYEILTSAVRPWNYQPFTNRYVNLSGDLGSAMTANPHLKVLAACGYYDLATPHFAIEYSLDHLPIDRSLRGNVRVAYYHGGHMMYTSRSEMAKLKTDLAGFVRDAIPGP